MSSDTDEKHARTGITWDAAVISFDRVRASSPADVLDRFRIRVPEYVWNAAALEGNPMTHDEVAHFVVDGPGRTPRNDDEVQVRNLAHGYEVMAKLVRSGGFDLSKPLSDELHGYVGRYEAIEAGHFRGQGSVQGGGAVRLADGGYTPGRDPGACGVNLIRLHESLLTHLGRISDPRERALVYFAAATRAQFYFDANKRTARIMASGMLLRSGYDALNVPVARHDEFDKTLDDMFRTDNATKLLQFLVRCLGD